MARPLKKGVVEGLTVEARPVPFLLVRRMIEAERSKDDSEKLLVMADTVAECVTLDDARPLDVDGMDVETIVALYAFAVKPSSADFTPPASPGGTEPGATAPPPMT